MIESIDYLDGRRIEPGELLQFSCGAELACFNSCCRNKRLPLFPYDVLRLRRGVRLPSEQLLERHVELELDPSSGWPAPRIRLEQDGRCPFVGQDGCGVYAHRPVCCRIYPLARGVAPGGPGVEPREVFVVVESECLGWGTGGETTLERWIEGQGLEPYHAANNRILEFFMHPRRRSPMELTPRQIHGVLMALYNLDVWRQTVQTPGFGDRFQLSDDRIARALERDEDLLDLGQDWITAQFFGEE